MDLVSIHQAAAWLQATPFQIRRAAAQLGLDVDCRINGVDCFRDTDVDRIAAHLAACRGRAMMPTPFNIPIM